MSRRRTIQSVTLAVFTFLLTSTLGIIVDAIGPSIPLWATIAAAVALSVVCYLLTIRFSQTKETSMADEEQRRPKLTVIGGRFDDNQGAGISLSPELSAHIEGVRARRNGQDGLQVRDPREGESDDRD